MTCVPFAAGGSDVRALRRAADLDGCALARLELDMRRAIGIGGVAGVDCSALFAAPRGPRHCGCDDERHARQLELLALAPVAMTDGDDSAGMREVLEGFAHTEPRNESAVACYLLHRITAGAPDWPWLVAAAERGFAVAMLELGHRTWAQPGRALVWFERGAELGCVGALMAAGMLLTHRSRSANDPVGTRRGLRYIMAAAGQGDPRAERAARWARSVVDAWECPVCLESGRAVAGRAVRKWSCFHAVCATCAGALPTTAACVLCRSPV